MLYQLSYFRKNKPYQSIPSLTPPCDGAGSATPTGSFFLWEVMDSNHRRRTPADLQSAPFGHSGNFPCLAPLPYGTAFSLGFFLFYPGLTSPARCAARLALSGRLRSTDALRRENTSSLSKLPVSKGLSHQTSPTVILFFDCCHRQGLFHSSSRRLSEPMEGFEPPTS